MTNVIFNANKTDYEAPSLLLGKSAPGLFDTINKQYPKIWDLYKLMKKLDWDENEFNYSSCNVEFKTCPPSTYDMMIRTLAWQWEADSVAARMVLPVGAPFISSPELLAAWSAVNTNEVLHSATYSEIVRNSFDDPKEVLSEILKVTESLQRLDTVSESFKKAYLVSHQYALGMVENDQETYNAAYMFVVTMLVLERIQFMASFAITFCICDTGLFQPIGKAVQKIAQDEFEVHVQVNKAVIEYEHKTVRGQLAKQQCKTKVQAIVDEVVASEFKWLGYMFSDGRELVGANADLLKKWVLFNAKEIIEIFELDSKHELPKVNPLKFMENWLNIGKTQPSPQEQANGQYKLNVMVRDDAMQDFAVDF